MLIKIKNLRLKTIIGVHEWEKKINREIIINAELEAKNSKSTISDKLEDTIDYDAAVNKIKSVVKNGRFKLVEKLAGEIMKEIFADKKIKRCKIEIDKVGAVVDLESFSVTLEKIRK